MYIFFNSTKQNKIKVPNVSIISNRDRFLIIISNSKDSKDGMRLTLEVSSLTPMTLTIDEYLTAASRLYCTINPRWHSRKLNAWRIYPITVRHIRRHSREMNVWRVFRYYWNISFREYNAFTVLIFLYGYPTPQMYPKRFL